MKNGKTQNEGPFSHERAVLVDWDGETQLRGFVFGQETVVLDPKETKKKEGYHRASGIWFTVCIPRSSFVENGIEARGPSVNKQFHESEVVFIIEKPVRSTPIEVKPEMKSETKKMKKKDKIKKSKRKQKRIA